MRGADWSGSDSAVDIFASCPLGCLVSTNSSVGPVLACSLCPPGRFNAVLQVTTLGKLANLSDSSLDRDAAQISSNAAVAAFFGLGFSGKAALVQMWTHVVQQHTSGGC